MPQTARSAAARADLRDAYVYLAEEASEAVAERFWQNAEDSFALLTEQPYIGTALKLKSPALSGLRKWSVKDFDAFLIFYAPRPTGILIVRVLHGSRDWWNLLGLMD